MRKFFSLLLCASAGMVLFVLSCNNPFSNNLGKKVEFQPPIIDGIVPVSGLYIMENTVFTGRASAQRELRRVQVRILDPSKKEPTPLPGWDWDNESDDNNTIIWKGDNVKELKEWSFSLNTLDETMTGINGGLDGFVKLQFRALDSRGIGKGNDKNDGITPTVEMVYIVKNRPSDVKVTSPTISTVPPEGTLITGEEIRGQITDRRGIKPGYPKIKIWSTEEDEPEGEDSWATLFLTGGSAAEGFDDPLTGEYNYIRRKDSQDKPYKVFNVVTFNFPLFEYDLYEDPQIPGHRLIRYRQNDEGERIAFEANRQFNFKIKSSDSYSNPLTKVPEEPPGPEQREILSYFPPRDYGGPQSDPAQEGGPVLLTLKSSEVHPTIALNNSDKTVTELAMIPNPWITEVNSQKIALGRTDRPDFRLRVFAYHPDFINSATLEYRHGSGPVQPLTWDIEEDFEDGKMFTYVADGSKTDAEGNLIFKSNAEAYVLIVTAYTSETLFTVREYSVRVYGEGPVMDIRSIKGAFEEPIGVGLAMDGGKINPNEYVVNDIVQVFSNYSTPINIREDGNGTPLVKWIVEDKSPWDDPTSTRHDLIKYKADPYGAGNLDFFTIINEKKKSGWVHAEANRSFKFDTRDYDDNDELWLYIIAQDGVGNLGFILQKLVVDQSTDDPRLKDVPNFFPTDQIDAVITKPHDLLIPIKELAPSGGNTLRKNILENEIEINFIDDDGINLNDDDNSPVISVTYHNTGTTISATGTRCAELMRAILKSGNARDRYGKLTQKMIAAIYYEKDLDDSDIPDLPEGIYEISFILWDDKNEKVSITGAEVPSDAGENYDGTAKAVKLEKTFIFAVYNGLPIDITQMIDIKWKEDPEIDLSDYSTQNNIKRTLLGTVKTRIKLHPDSDGEVQITFTPDVITPDYTSADSTRVEIVILHADAEGNEPFTKAIADETGLYTYYWSIPNVSFDPGVFADDNSGERKITIKAYNGLGGIASPVRIVTIDRTAPILQMYSFNENRGLTVNGKVVVEVVATDNTGIREEEGIKWWLVSTTSGTTPPGSWGDYPYEHTGFFGPVAPNGRSDGIINTAKIPDGNYTLFIMARDNANNNSNVVTQSGIIIDQKGDIPVLNTRDLSPTNDAIMSILDQHIRGTVSDDDGFDKNKLADYIQIRFREKGEDGNFLSWGDWISVDGELDSTGEMITFDFDVGVYFTLDDYPADYINAEGNPKYYQIMVTDEPARKNPDGATQDSEDYLGAAHSDPSELSFRQDSAPPEIFFDYFDPTNGSGHNYSPNRPAYFNKEKLAEHLSGTIKEENLVSVLFKYGAREERFEWSEHITSMGGNEYSWVIDPAWLAGFDTANQGIQSITIEATDIANQSSSVTWIFDKDTNGPEISFSNITRAINHAAVPTAGDFPTDNTKWPYDWPTAGGAWTTAASWETLRGKGVANWPSEFAFFTDNPEQKIIDALKKDMYSDNDATPRKATVVSSKEDSDPVAIRGRFYDTISDIWGEDGSDPSFKYRFNSNGRDDDKEWENGDFTGILTGSKKNSGTWEIPLDAFDYLTDGPHTFDIQIADIGNNVTELYGLRFIVDRKAPSLQEPAEFIVGGNLNDGTGVNFPKALEEAAHRVFSAAGASNDNATPVFTLTGSIWDNNLNRIIAEIRRSEGDVTPLKIELPDIMDYFSTHSGVYTVDNLSITRTDNSDLDGQRQWDWTLTMTLKDFFTIRQGESADNVPRTVRITAYDIADKRALVIGGNSPDWRFYLDSAKPSIEYINISAGPAYTIFEGGAADIVLQGTVSDDNRIRDIRYLIGKWDYENGNWTYYDKTSQTWTTTTAPEPYTVVSGVKEFNWPSLVPELESFTASNAQRAYQWKLNRAILKEWDTELENLFAEEGKYRIDLYVTDWSLSTNLETVGNPRKTDSGNFDGSGDAVSARSFFVDRGDPVVKWEWDFDITDPKYVEEKKYYRNDNAVFHLRISDPNTIASVSASMTVPVGTYDSPIVIKYAKVENPGNNFDNTDYTGNIAEAFKQWNATTKTWVYNVWILPTMVVGGTPVVTDFGACTLSLDIKDGAQNTAMDNRNKQFTLDPDAPEIVYARGDGPVTQASAGRITIRGNVTDESGKINRVAFYVANNLGGNNFGAPAAYTDGADGWYYWDTSATPPTSIMNNSFNPERTMMKIEGRESWNIAVNTRITEIGNGPDYVQWKTYAAWQTSDSINLTFPGRTILGTDQIGKLTIYVVAIDEAGNITVIENPQVYWIYPEGDRPAVTRINNPDPRKIETERLLNGQIRVSGMAVDNERIKNVWIRVTVGGNPVHERLKAVPQWNPVTWEPDNSKPKQEPVKLVIPENNTEVDGWYMANGGGGSRVSWWIYINNEGELDPDNIDDKNEIIIEVRCEDTILKEGEVDEWEDGPGLISRKSEFFTVSGITNPIPADEIYNLPAAGDTTQMVETTPTSVTAFVVSGAPEFVEEEILLEDRGRPWSGIDYTSISKAASYRVTVRSIAGIKSLRWIPTKYTAANSYPFSQDTMNGVNLFAGNGTYDNGNISISAVPKNPVTGSQTFPNKRTFFIYQTSLELIAKLETIEPYSTASNSATAAAAAGVQYAVITIPAGTPSFDFGTLGSAVLIEKTIEPPETGEGSFKWQITVRVDSTAIAGGAFAEKAVRYPVYLEATDISKTNPLTASITALLPIDNQYPEGRYTNNPRLAGSNATIGGEAGDYGDVRGLARVVVWFTKPGSATPLNWKKGSATPYAPGEPLAEYKKSNGTPGTNLAMPYIPGFNESTDSNNKVDNENTFATGGDYAIVIDRTGNTPHHGHQLKMGFAVGGSLGTTWYAEFDSNGLDSGPVTLHYVVYDKAGNATYYTQRLVVMNGAPIIGQVKLGTDIRAGLSFTNNSSVKDNSLFNAIRAGSFVSDTVDVRKGITPFEQTTIRKYGAVREIDFNARNQLLALRVEMSNNPLATKTRVIRFEYVSHGKDVTLDEVKAGRVYMINNPGTDLSLWNALGATGDRDDWEKGFVFMAASDGTDENGVPIITKPATTPPYPSSFPTAWELNGNYYTDTLANETAETVAVQKYARATNAPPGVLALSDIHYGALSSEPPYARNAEFVYNAAAFGTTVAQSITDVPEERVMSNGRLSPYPFMADGTVSDAPWETHSLFILKVFDGPEDDAFADLVLLSVNVNNNDITPPFAQLYDLNPKTEANPPAPGIGDNRALGGLWAGAEGVSGHIEPRRTATGGNDSGFALTDRTTNSPSTYGHSLSSAQMGGAATQAQSTPRNPWANPAAFMDVDTVSGSVILRGYIEDDQQIEQVDLWFYKNATIGATPDQTVSILEKNGSGVLVPVSANSANIQFASDIDLYRHRVEWAYKWNTAEVPSSFILGDVAVRVVAYNAHSASQASKPIASAAPMLNDINNTGNSNLTYNPGLPAGIRMYNTIAMAIRPYLAGFRRDESKFYHNERSRQGWYMFSRGEDVAAAGFTIGGVGTTTITLPGVANPIPTDGLTSGEAALFGIDSGLSSETLAASYRKFTVDPAAGSGPIQLTVTLDSVNYPENSGDYPAVNVFAGKAAQPWNVQYDPGIEGSDLWDDYVHAHIWQSQLDTNNSFPDSFPVTANFNVIDPAMTVDPATGTLYASHIELGTGTSNGANVRTSSNNGAPSAATSVRSFDGMMANTDISFSATTPHVAYSTQGRVGEAGQNWADLGGIDVNQGNKRYVVESAWYNASRNSGFLASPPSVNQFRNPHVAVNGSNIHTSYYDSKDGSIKYKYQSNNDIATPIPTTPTSPATVIDYSNTAVQTMRSWVNLDGGFDADDRSLIPNYVYNSPLVNSFGDNVTYPTAIGATTTTPSGTPYTFSAAFNNGTLPADRFVREVLVGVGQEVVAGDAIYMIGKARQEDGSNLTPVLTQRSGIVTRLEYREALTGTVDYTTRRALALSGYAFSYTPTIVHRGVWGSINSGNFSQNNIVTYNGQSYIYYNTTGTAINAASNDQTTEPASPNWAQFGTYGIVNYRGTWNAATAYSKNDMVLYKVGQPEWTTRVFIKSTNDTGSETTQPISSRKWTMIDWTLDGQGNATRNRVNRLSNVIDGVRVKRDEIVLFIGQLPSNSGSDGSYYYYAVRAPESGTIRNLPTGTTVDTDGNTRLFTIDTDNYKYHFNNFSYSNTNYTPANTHAYTIADINTNDGTFTRIKDTSRAMNVNNGSVVSGKAPRQRINAGEHNAIALTSEGYPVVAYFDQTNQILKLAISNSVTPTLASNWTIDKVIPDGNMSQFGTGEYVSIQIDSNNKIHMAAFNSISRQLVYITGTLNGSTLDRSTVQVRVVDSLGNVGRWCKLSLDKDDNPHIAYQDESYQGAMDGVKMAFYNSRYQKQLSDVYGQDITGWETMHVPARYQVRDSRIGLECYPRPGGSGSKFWSAAIGYLSPDRYRIAYYVKEGDQ